LLEKALNERRALIENKVNSMFSCEGVKVHLMIRQGQPTKEIMKFAVKQKIDLIVLGRKNEKKGGGILINRLARRASCSLLVIPKDIEVKLDKVLVPIDFSNYSKLALEKALDLAEKSENNPKIIVQNVFQVPSGYHYTGKSFSEFAEVMKGNAEKDYKLFSQGISAKDVDMETLYTLDKDDDIIPHIYKKAKSMKADMIIIGAKGRSATTALFIGSKAERLIQVDTDIPMMVVRPKGKSAGIIEYLQEL
ncbi:MAG: universal stress protein, partial [Cyclobacteriaceae bacterium]|nr:universal stress protein [Cyclobacteriaceae bacterium HetDA_MAG_MS6]